MAALGGTVFILGDDPRYLSPKRAALLMSPEILALAREGVAARPLDVAARRRPGGRRAHGMNRSSWGCSTGGTSRCAGRSRWRG
ncbi:MAG: hypothetical protein U0531_20995 [Dehalococcoidia bacterium]